MKHFLLLPLVMDSTVCFSPKSVNMEFETSILMDADKLMHPRSYVETVQNVLDAFQDKAMLRAVDNAVHKINLRKSLENIVNNKYILRAAQSFLDKIKETFTSQNENSGSEGPNNIRNVLRNKPFLQTAQNFWTHLQKAFAAKDNDGDDDDDGKEMRGTSKGSGDLLDHRNILRTAQNVIQSLQNVILPAKNAENKTGTPNNKKLNSDKVFSNFIQDLDVVLLNYDDDALKVLTNVLHREVRRYYRDGPFNSVLYNPKLKNFVIKTLKGWTDSKPTQLKAKIKHYMRDTTNADFVQTFDQFFVDNDLNHLERLLKRLRKNSMQPDKMDLTDIIKKAFAFLILDRYNHLDDRSKVKFGKEIIKIGDAITEKEVDMLNVFRQAVDHTFRRFMKELSTNSTRSDLLLIPHKKEAQTATTSVKNYNLIAALQNKNVIHQEVTSDAKKYVEIKNVSVMGLNDGAEKYIKSITEKTKPLEFY